MNKVRMIDLKIYIYITKCVKRSMVIEIPTSNPFPSIVTIYLPKVTAQFKQKNKKKNFTFI